MSDEELTPVEGEETEEAIEETPEVEGEEEAEAPAPEPSVKDLLTKLEKMERRTQYLQRKLEKPPKQEEPPAKAELPQRPKLDQYDTTEDYEDALFEWRDTVRDIKTSSKRQEEAFDEAVQAFNKNAQSMRKEFEDFDEVVEAPVFTPSMRMAIMQSDNGPQLAYHLGKTENWDLAEKIRTMPIERQLYELGKLETQLVVSKKTKKATTAPEPIKPVGMSGGGEKDPSKMTTAEWMAWDKQRTIEKLKSKYGGT